jgi:phage terminase large subunit
VGGEGSGRGQRRKTALDRKIQGFKDAKEERDVAGSYLERWQDPVLFANDVFGIDLWDKQAEVAQAIAFSEFGRVAVRSGHKVGKSLLDMVIACQFVLTKPEARVVLTAPTGRQVRSILWRELNLLHTKARWPLGGKLSMQPDIGWQFPDGREVVGFATDEPERMAGISGQNVLFIVDEASGVPEAIFEAIEGNRAGGAKILLTSNPTKTSGTFFDAFNEKRSLWDTFHISSDNTPNALTGQRLVPGLATREWCNEKLEEWGADSPLYAVRVKGNFPREGFNTVIPIHLLELALDGWADVVPTRDDQAAIGADIARFGDDETCLFPRRGLRAFTPEVYTNLRTEQVVGHIIQMAQKLRVHPREIVRVNVDVIGLGAGVYDGLMLVAADRGLEVCAINSSERAEDSERYFNVRTEMWFQMRDWLRAGGKLPEGVAKLESELVAPQFEFDGAGRYKVEGKKEIKKRLKRSPDRADGLALSIYDAASVETSFFTVKSARV